MLLIRVVPLMVLITLADSFARFGASVVALVSSLVAIYGSIAGCVIVAAILISTGSEVDCLVDQCHGP